MYVEVNGLKGLALLDSGSSIDAMSPEFARVSNAKTFQLDKPVGLQLRCVGSRLAINYSTQSIVSLSNCTNEVYFDIVNLDHYDMILGIPFLHQFGIKIDFENDLVVVGGMTIASLKGGEGVHTAKPTRHLNKMAAKYEWATKAKDRNE
ncbi:hypothetical protein K474DRAFT_1608019 [Panus rudis PR-1116 ss-1]|nr:hypothetical protein K474DRAFT_1608019 [Panus rudis PR-1116 ss-1]